MPVIVVGVLNGVVGVVPHVPPAMPSLDESANDCTVSVDAAIPEPESV